MSAKIQDAERPWVEGYTLRRQTELIARVRAAGYRDDTALGLAGWLAVKAADLPDRSGSPTRARYRKILREIGAPTGAARVKRATVG